MLHSNPSECGQPSKELVVVNRQSIGKSNPTDQSRTGFLMFIKMGFRGKPSFCDKKETVMDSEMFETEETIFYTPDQANKLNKGHRLIVLSGDLPEKTYYLNHSKLMIGRDKSAHIRITDKSVSLYHGMICNKAKTCTLKDLNSKNGILVNGYPIQESQKLRDGDRIKIGPTLFTFIHDAPDDSHGMRKFIVNTAGVLITAGAIVMSLLFSFNQIKANDTLPASFVERSHADASPAPGENDTSQSTEISTAQQATAPAQASPVSLEEQGQQLIQKAVQYYINGNISMSVSTLQETMQLNLPQNSPLKTNASAIKDAIMATYRLYEEGLKHYNEKNMGQAIKIWSQALEIDQNFVGHTSSYLAGQIADYTGDLFYTLAQEAYDKGDHENAQAYCSQTFRILENHEGCSAILNALSAGSEQ